MTAPLKWQFRLSARNVAAHQLRLSIPEGWAVDAQGNPTTDPGAALKGAMLPFGGAKGYGIALMIDLFCGAMAGANTGTSIKSFWTDFQNPQGVGFFLGAWNLAVLGDLAEVRERVDAWAAAAGTRLMLNKPGNDGRGAISTGSAVKR